DEVVRPRRELDASEGALERARLDGAVVAPREEAARRDGVAADRVAARLAPVRDDGEVAEGSPGDARRDGPERRERAPRVLRPERVLEAPRDVEPRAREGAVAVVPRVGQHEPEGDVE